MRASFLFLICAAAAAGSASATAATITAHDWANPIVSVDIIDLFWARITGDPPTRDEAGIAATRKALHDAGSRGFTFARFGAASFWPPQFALWWNATTRARYWAVMDELYADARAAGVVLMPSILFDTFVIPDSCGEPFGAMFRDPSSCSRRALKNYTRQFIARYYAPTAAANGGKKSTVAAGHLVELTNELNLQADLNMTGRRAGLPSVARTQADNMSTADMMALQTDWVSWIRAASDPAGRARAGLPPLAVTSGHAIPRGSAWHLRESYHAPRRDWSADTQQQFEQTIGDQNAAVDVVSVHVYPNAQNVRPKWTPPIAQPSGLVAAAASAAFAHGKGFYLGEFGVQVADRPYINKTADGKAYAYFSRAIDAVAAAAADKVRPKGAFVGSTTWVWEFTSNPPNNDTWSLWPGRDDPMIATMQAANKRARVEN